YLAEIVLRLGCRQPHLQGLELALQLALLRGQTLQLVDFLIRLGAQYLAHIAENPAVMLDVRIRSRSSEGLNTTYPRASTSLIGHGKKADLSGGSHVRAATELLAKARHFDGTHFLTVFFTKQCQ